MKIEIISICQPFYHNRLSWNRISAIRKLAKKCFDIKLDRIKLDIDKRRENWANFGLIYSQKNVTAHHKIDSSVVNRWIKFLENVIPLF